LKRYARGEIEGTCGRKQEKEKPRAQGRKKKCKQSVRRKRPPQKGIFPLPRYQKRKIGVEEDRWKKRPGPGKKRTKLPKFISKKEKAHINQKKGGKD